MSGDSKWIVIFICFWLSAEKNVHQFDHVNRRRGNVKSYETEQLYFFRHAYIPVILHQSVISVLLYLRPKH